MLYACLLRFIAARHGPRFFGKGASLAPTPNPLILALTLTPTLIPTPTLAPTPAPTLAPTPTLARTLTLTR